MKKRIIVAALVVLAVLLGVCLFFPKNEHMDKEPIKEDTIQIGMSFDSFVTERWLRDRDVFVSTARALGAEVNVQNANGDIEEQRKHIDYFIDRGMDAIVIISVDSYGLSEHVKKALDAGIKVISYDRLIANGNVDLYISFDNAMVGTMMGQALVDNGISGGCVLMLGGSSADSNVPMVENAFREIMQQNNVTIIDSIHALNWEAEVAGAYIYEHMDKVTKADGIMCGNDNLASQAVPALASKRLAGQILVVGQDADLQACQRIVEGTQLMTVYKPVEKLAKRAAECTVELIETGKIAGEELSLFDDGMYEVPYIGMMPVSVTEENIKETIIDSGFHLKEDVYLNVPEKMPK